MQVPARLPGSASTDVDVSPETNRQRADAIQTSGEQLGISVEDLRSHIETMGNLVRRLGAHRDHIADLVNDAFVVACGKPKERRPDPADRKAMRRWLCSIVKNITLRHLRRQQNAPDIVFEQETLENVRDGSDTFLFVGEFPRLAVVFHALGACEQRLVIEHVIHERCIRELAAEQDVPPSTVFSRISAALRSMREQLEEDERPRRVVVLVPFVFFVLFIREARAHIAAARRRLVASAGRAPMRALGSVGAAVVVLASPSSQDPSAMPGPISIRGHAVAEAHVPVPGEGGTIAVSRFRPPAVEEPSAKQRARGAPRVDNPPATKKGRSALAMLAENALKTPTGADPEALMTRPESKKK